MKNICRPFILYTDFLPPSYEPHKDWQYMAWGYFDGIRVEKDLFEDGGCDFNKLWEFSGRQKERLDGSFSQQIVFGFRSEEDAEEAEKSFWDEEKVRRQEYPFIFLCLLQSNQKGVQLKDSWKKRRELEQRLSIGKQQKAITYLTLDHSDLLLVLRCKSYNTGAKTIDSFHRKEGGQNSQDGISLQFFWSNKYSFTIAGVDKELMEQDRIDCGGEVVDNAYIFGIERKPGSINPIYQEIKNSNIGRYVDKKKQAIPGFNDELIVLSQVPWNLFLQLYRNETGILNHTNSLYQSCLIGATTILGKIQPDILTEAEEQKKRERSKFLEGLWKDCMNLEIKNGIDRGQNRSIRQTLCSIINSMEKFEDSPFAEYVFFSTFQPMRMLIDLLQEEQDRGKEREVYDSFYKFVKGFSFYAQNSVRSDRQLIQTPDFNLRLYEIPAKVNSFYNAFIYNIRSFLNCSPQEAGVKSHSYEFLTCPGMNSNMQVEELFAMVSTERRLFLVNIPEHQAYAPQLMMVMLGHEVGHFVGSEMRNRDIRYDYILKSLARIFSVYLKKELIKKYGEKSGREYMEEELYWKEHLEKRLWEYMDGVYRVKKGGQDGVLYMEQDDVEWMEKNLNNFGHHSLVMRTVIPYGMVRALRKEKEMLFSYLYEREFQYIWASPEEEEDTEKRKKDAEKGKKGLQEFIDTLADSFIGYDTIDKERLNGDFAINMLIGLTKECVADLIGILSLKLSLEEYLCSILENIQGQRTIDDIEDAHVLRVVLVISCMLRPSSGIDGRYYWDQGELLRLQGEGYSTDNKALFSRVLVEQLNYYFISKEEAGDRGEPPIDEKHRMAVFYDSEVLGYLIKYLQSCKKLFYENQKIMNPENEEHKKLLKMYRIFEEEDIEEIIGQMQICIDAYRDRVRKELW